jgi:hypothetical protein
MSRQTAKGRRLRRMDDPVVEEVRAVRAQLWREAGGTPEGLIALLNERWPMKGRPRRRASNPPKRKRP